MLPVIWKRNWLGWLLTVGFGMTTVAVAGTQNEPPPQRALGVGHSQPVVAIAYSPDGKSLPSASRDMTVILWDVPTTRPRHTLAGHSKVPSAIAFSADGKSLASCGRNSYQMELIRWSTDNGKQVDRRTLKVNNTLSVDCPTFSRDGRRLANLTNVFGRPHVRVWDVAGGEIVAEYPTRSATKMGTRPPSLSFDPGGKVVTTAESKIAVRLYRLADDRDESFPQALPVCRSALFSPDGKTIAAVVSDGDPTRGDTSSVVLLDVAEKKAVRRFPIGAGRTEVVLSPDGTLLASIGQGVSVWDAKTGKRKARLLIRFQKTYGHQRLAFSPDGRTLAAANGSRVEMWDVSRFK